MNTDSPPNTDAGTIQCARCARSNPTGRRFCAGCGVSLTHPCNHCQNACSVDESFCGQCGTDLGAWLAEQERELTDAYEKAHSLRAAADSTAAQRVLGAFGESRFGEHIHPRLHDAHARVRGLLDELRRETHTAKVTSEQHVAEARKRFEKRQFRQAFDLLSKVPDGHRDQDMRRLLADVQAQLQTIQSLRSDIRVALDSKQTLGLIPTVMRLRKLQPDDQQLVKLVEQLAEQHVRAAHKRVSLRQYQQAHELLAKIDPEVRSAEAKTLIEQVSEVCYVLYELKTSPVVDGTLADVAKRVRKLPLNNQTVEQRCDQALARAEQSASGDFFRTPWVAEPEASAMGVPMQLPRRWQIVDDSPVRDSDAYRDHAERFSVAIGLALQGLDQAVVKTNLIPKQSNWRTRLSGLIKKGRHPIQSAWGVDWGKTGIKAVKLEVTPVDESGGDEQDTRSIRVTQCELLTPSTREENDSNGAGKARPYESALLAKLLERTNQLAAEKICVGAPGADVLNRYLAIPRSSPDKVHAAIGLESRHQIPFNLDEVIWDYHVFGKIEKQEEYHGTIPVGLIAAKDWKINELLAPFQELDIRVDAVQSGCVALHNLVHHSAKEAGEVIGVVDVGYETTNIAVIGGPTFWSRTCGVGGKAFETALLREFNLTRHHARRFLHQIWKAPRLGRVAKAFLPAYEELRREIELSLAAFTRSTDHIEISRLICLGGGTRIHGLLRHLLHGPCPFIE